MKYEPNAPTAMIWRVLLASVGVLFALNAALKLTGPSPLLGVLSLPFAAWLIALAVRGRPFSLR